MTGATLPIALNDERFISKWSEYETYRKEKRLQKLLPRSVQKQWDRLADFGIEVACAAIDETIAQGWTGIFPHKVSMASGRPDSAGVRGNAGFRASLGALQIQLKQVESDLEDLIYPGGCAFPRTLTLEQSKKAERLREERRRIKERMSCT